MSVTPRPSATGTTVSSEIFASASVVSTDVGSSSHMM